MAHSFHRNLEPQQQQVSKTSGLIYNTSLEIFIALRDVDYTYYLDDTKKVIPCLKKVDRYVTVYTQPVGALRDVEKCKTEVLYRNKNPAFVTKVNLDFDIEDLTAIFLNCKVSFWEAVTVPVHRILQAGAKGLDIPLKLKFEYNQTDVHNKYTDFACSEVVPGRLFLRAEIIQPIYKGVVLQFGLTKPRSGFSTNLFLELSKINEGNLFDPATAFPYTIIHRTPPKGNFSKDPFWSQNYFFVNTICNGDMDRVLKIEIHKADCKGQRPHFVLTTLAQILQQSTSKLPITSSLDGSIHKTNELAINLVKEVELNSFDYYVKQGMNFRRIYAVDLSNSNWKINLHKFNLHEPQDGGISVYEEALQIIAGATHPYTESSDDAVFYSFGNPKMEPYVATFSIKEYINSLVWNYREALMHCRMAEATISTKSVPQTAQQQESTARSSFACFPTPCNPLGLGSRGTLLTPLLKNIEAFLSAPTPHLQYNTVYVFTDGQISDTQEAMEIISRLSSLPVSLVFIGIGSGEFLALQELRSAWLVPQKGSYCLRNIVHLVYFRSFLEWNSAIKFAKYNSKPLDILRKEIFTVIIDHCLTYMRLFRPEI